MKNLETSLKPSWTLLETYFKLLWKPLKHYWNIIEIFLNPPWNAIMGAFKYYIRRFSQIFDPHPPKFADVMFEQKVGYSMTYTTRFRLSKYAFLIS